MNKPIITKRNSVRCHTPGLAYPPQQCGGHSFAGAFGVGLFVNNLQFFGVNTDKQLRNTLPRKTNLNINDDTAIQDLSVCSVVELAISPQPKCRSAMGHFLRTPFLREAVDRKGRRLKYGQISKASINFNKRYRCNVLAPKKIDGEMVTTRITNDENVSRHEER